MALAGNCVPGRDGLRTAQPILRVPPALPVRFVGCAEARSASRRGQALAQRHPQRIEGSHRAGVWRLLHPPMAFGMATHGGSVKRDPPTALAGNHVPERDGLRTAQPILRVPPVLPVRFVGCAEATKRITPGLRALARRHPNASRGVTAQGGWRSFHPPMTLGMAANGGSVKRDPPTVLVGNRVPGRGAVRGASRPAGGSWRP